MRKYKLTHLFIFCCLTVLVSCSNIEEIENPIDLITASGMPDTVLTSLNVPYNITFIPSSRQKVYITEGVSSYSSTTKVGENWNMWFTSKYTIYQLFSNNKGANFEKLFTDNQYIAVGNNRVINGDEGATDFCTFYDSKQSLYKMIFQINYAGNNTHTSSCIVESTEGVNWSNPVIFENKLSDTQPGVVQKNNKYYVYMRHKIDGRIRVITVRTLDATTHKQVASARQLPRSPFVGYPHLYNNAASKLDDTFTLFFPTIYNDQTQDCRIVWGYSSDNYTINWSNVDLSSIFVNTDQSKWFIISPSFIPSDDPEYYWIYYYTRNVPHDQYLSATSTEYWRIKVRIQQKFIENIE